MVGVSYRDASFDLLERLAFPGPCRAGLMRAVLRSGASEAAVLSTCCRTEIYAVVGDGCLAGMEQRLLQVLARRGGLPASEIAGVARRRSEEELVVHLLRVACGLESRLPGEVDVVAQVRAAAAEAGAAGTLGSELGHLFAAASATARRVHRNTALGSLGRSMGRRGVELGLATLDADAADAAVVVLGTGRMAAAAVAALTAAGVRSAVCGRNPDSTIRLAVPGGSALSLGALPAALAGADLLICCTGASEPLLDATQVGRVQEARGGRPLTVLDLSVPRNVDRRVGALPAVRLIDLQSVGEDPAIHAQLSEALTAAGDIAARETIRFFEARRARAAGPLIAALRDRLEDLCRNELRRAAATEGIPVATADRMAATVAAKLLHQPTLYARRVAAAGDICRLAELEHMLLPGRAAPPRPPHRGPNQAFPLPSKQESCLAPVPVAP